ncbi:MAG TPA: TetR/AcrR family transcriptional regulator [Caulobacteraceae bacterium]
MPRALSSDDIADFRERLCDAAETLFAEHGTEAVTIRQLAAKLGVSPMTPYRYFKDKDAILAAVRARGFDRFAAALEGAHGRRRRDPEGRAHVIGEAYVRFAFDNPQAYKLMFDITQAGEELYPDLVRAAERARATMTLHLEGPANGAAREDLNLIGHAYWAAMHGPIMLQLSGKLAPPVDASALIDVLTGALARTTGLLNRDP